MKINIVNCFTTIIAVVVHIQFCYSSYSCPKSTPTISYVKSCPKNKSEWDSAANRKQCSSIANDLKCATPTSNFKYHCLLNRWRNATLEVCTSIFHLQGYCAVYDTQLHRVAENYEPDFECFNFHGDERCPPRYPSTDAYKYQKCYTKASFTTTTTTATEATATKITTNRESRPAGNDGVKIAFLVILSVVVIVLLSFILWKHGSTIYKKVINCRDVESARADELVTSDGPETPSIEQPNSIQNTPESVQICMSGATCEPSERNSISSREDEKEPLLQSMDEDSSHVPIGKNTTSVQTYESPSSVASPSDKAPLSQSSNIQSSNISDEKAHATNTNMYDTDSSTESGDKLPSSSLAKEVQSPILPDKCADDKVDLSVTTLTSDDKPLSKQRSNGLKTSTSDDLSFLSPKPTPETPEEEASTFKSVDNKTTRENDEVSDSRSNDKLNPVLNNSSKEASTFKSVDIKQATRENDEVPNSKSNDELNPVLNNSKEEASTFKSVDNQATRESDEVPDSKSSDELNPFLNNSKEEASAFKSVDNQTTRENDEVPDSKSSDELNPFLNESKSDLLSTSDSLPPKTSNDGALANAKELPFNVVTEKESALGKNKKAPPRPTPPSLDNRSKESRREPSMKKQAPRPPPKQ